MRPDVLSLLFDLYASKDAVYTLSFAELLVTESLTDTFSRTSPLDVLINVLFMLCLIFGIHSCFPTEGFSWTWTRAKTTL